MPSNQQRREAARRHLERQLKRRQEREAARKRLTLILSVVGTILAVIGIAVLITVVGGSGDKTIPAGQSGSGTSTVQPSTPAPATSYPPATGAAVTFEGVSVTGAADLKGRPGVTSKSSKTPAKLLVKDLVVGKGAAATPASSVTVQYIGVRYKDGVKFDESWERGQPIEFSLQGVVPGFTQGIGGTTGVAAMKEGGRRIIILPAALGYPDGSGELIPPNTPLVFIVDLVKVSG